MKLPNISITLTTCVIIASASASDLKYKKSSLEKINKQLKKLCFMNPENYIKEQNVVKCEVSYNASCWKETLAGQSVTQPCPFLLYLTEGNISRRCDEQGRWQEVNVKNCRSLEPQKPVNSGKQTSNDSHGIPHEEDSMTLAGRVQMVYVACSWIAFLVLLPTFIVICVVMRNYNRFTLHKNLILAFILRILTLFIYYYGKMEEDVSNRMLCNAFWLLNRFFTASKVTWMLNEGIFLVHMLKSSFDDDFCLWYYLLFGWGFSAFLTFCVYLPYLQFMIARVSERCWLSHSHFTDMLMLYVPLTILLLINIGVAVYVVVMLAKKLKHTQTRHLNAVKKSAKTAAILIFLLGLIDLLAFYQPKRSSGYHLFVAVLDSFQGIMVCIFFVYMSGEFRESLKRKWMRWRYGILLETNPYSARHDAEAGPSCVEHTTSASVAHVESSEEMPFPSHSIASLQRTSRPSSTQTSRQVPDKRKKRNSQMQLLSRSSDLTKYRHSKVEPESRKPLRVQSAGPEAWQEIKLSENQGESPTLKQDLESNDGPSKPGQGLENGGLSASTESVISRVLGSQTSLRPKATPETELEANASAKLRGNIEEDMFSFSSQLSMHDIGPLTANKLKNKNSQMPLLSRSSDLTKYRHFKVEPEPLKSVRAQSAGPEAWQEIRLSENQAESSTTGQVLKSNGFSASTEKILSHLFGSQTSLPLETTPETELEASVSVKPTGSFEEEDAFSFSSQLNVYDTGLSTAELSVESGVANSSSDCGTSGLETQTTSPGPSTCQDATEIATSSGFWDKAKKIVAERRRSRADHNRVLSTVNDSSRSNRKYADKQKDANEYRAAWITKILKGDMSHETESDA